jgi:hypothetical protein
VYHSNTQALIDHWRGLKTGAQPPAREALDPADIADILTQVFLVGRGSAPLPFRLAGGLLTDLHGRGLRGEGFLELWTPLSRPLVREAAANAVRDREPVVVYADAAAVGGLLGLEILLAPLTGSSGGPDRLLGLYQPLSTLTVVRGEPIGQLCYRTSVRLAANEARAPRLRLAALDGVRL